MRRIVLILGLALTGCATRPATTQVAERPFGLAYDSNAAAALAFDPPLAMNVRTPDLSREGRGLSAFAGYEEQVTTYNYTYQRDEIDVRGEYGDLTRRAYTGQISVQTR